jgi:hypothetical protein
LVANIALPFFKGGLPEGYTKEEIFGTSAKKKKYKITAPGTEFIKQEKVDT